MLPDRRPACDTHEQIAPPGTELATAPPFPTRRPSSRSGAARRLEPPAHVGRVVAMVAPLGRRNSRSTAPVSNSPACCAGRCCAPKFSSSQSISPLNGGPMLHTRLADDCSQCFASVLAPSPRSCGRGLGPRRPSGPCNCRPAVRHSPCRQAAPSRCGSARRGLLHRRRAVVSR
jgi:hypothetical protein